jgi:hypothetical protein
MQLACLVGAQNIRSGAAEGVTPAKGLADQLGGYRATAVTSGACACRLPAPASAWP